MDMNLNLDYTALALRVAHILAAILAGGGSMFLFLAALPALQQLGVETRSQVHSALRSRWAMPLHAAILVLMVSGLWNFLIAVRGYELPRWYHMVFGIKFLLAMVVFAVAILLSGRSALAEKLRANARPWLGLNVALIVGIVILGAILRQAPRTPKAADTPTGDAQVMRPTD